jgi:hypothetical protein
VDGSRDSDKSKELCYLGTYHVSHHLSLRFHPFDRKPISRLRVFILEAEAWPAYTNGLNQITMSIRFYWLNTRNHHAINAGTLRGAIDKVLAKPA